MRASYDRAVLSCGPQPHPIAVYLSAAEVIRSWVVDVDVGVAAVGVAAASAAVSQDASGNFAPEAASPARQSRAQGGLYPAV